jgi:hypothetical protein
MNLDQQEGIPKTNGRFENFLPEYSVSLRKVDNQVDLEKALDLEQHIWDINNFGSLEEYEKYYEQSSTFAAFKDDECVGVTRMFKGHPFLPPFTSLPFENQTDKQQIIELCISGDMEELGTTAVDHEKSKVPRGILSLHMWRLAYRDAMQRDVKYWGIIMEPERVQAMNEKSGFTFRQLGPATEYQGGDCAIFMMDLQEVDKEMQRSMPELYDWFVREPLTTP